MVITAEPGTKLYVVFRTAPFSMQIDPRTNAPEPVINVQRPVYRGVRRVDGGDEVLLLEFTGERGPLVFQVNPQELLMWTEAPVIEPAPLLG